MARHLLASLLATALLGTLPASAQTVQPTITTGANPSRIAVNPVTNTIYVTNYDANTLSVIDGATGAVTNVPVGARPSWVAVNPETNKIYVSNTGANGSGPSLMVIHGDLNSINATLTVGDVGWTAINEITDKIYVERFGNGDEVNIILDERYVNTAATRSYQPVSIALNPYTNILYIVHRATGDVVAIDASVDQSTVQDNINNYPPLLCPNGSGGYKPSPGPNDPDPGPCINISDPPAAVTVNPVTDMIYAASDGTSDQIAVIRGSTKTNPHTASFLTPPGVTGAAKAIAVNPVSNKVYAVFANHIVIVNGADNAMTVIPSPGAVAIGINTSTNIVYVPHADGTLKVIDGASNAVTATLTTAADARAIAVNPVTNMVYVVTAAGVTPVVGAPGSATIPLTVAITPLPNDTTNNATMIDMNTSASGGFAPSRRVYWQIDSTTGPWYTASNNGNGSYTAGFANLANGPHTIHAFATNALDAMSIMTDVQNNPLVGSIASYSFTVGPTGPENPSFSMVSSQNPSTAGQNVTFTASVAGSQGTATGTVSFLDGGTAMSGCGNVALSGGSAACTLSTLSIGTHSITAQYAGSASYNPSTTSAIQQTVNGSSTASPAVMMLPAPGSTLAGSTQTFTWTDSGASLYQVWVGNTRGSFDLGYYPTASTSATSTTINGLPTDGRTLCIRLYSQIGGAWYSRDYTYVASSTVSPAPAVLLSPAPGTTLSNSRQAFSWNDAGADLYQLLVGSTPGANDLGSYPAAPSSATSTTVATLPNDGRTLYVRLNSHIGGVWYSRDYTFTAASPQSPATITSPPPGSTLSSPATFTWTDSGATFYQVWVGNSPGSHDLGYYPAAYTSGTSTTINGLPTDGRTLYVRLYSYIQGTWYPRDFTYIAGP